MVIIFGIGSIGLVLIPSQNVHAYTCAVKAPSVPLKYYYLQADSVFVGTVSSITNDTTHQYVIKFDLEKSWKGSQHPTITTYSLVACGYSFIKGEKYLVFASGNPPDYFEWATKPLNAAQGDIEQIDSTQFQTQADTDEQLYKKLVNARGAISNMMGSKMSDIPISSVSVNDLNFTLDVGIADKQAATQSGIKEYKTKIEQIVGNVPITIQYEEYATAADNLTSQKPQCCGPPYVPKSVDSPLKQFKSGVTTQNITCKEEFVLAIKKYGHQPACVSPDTFSKLVLRGWSENPLNELLLRYGNQTQANLVFYDIMNEPKIRDWSMTGWKYSDYSYGSNGETHQSSAAIRLYLPSNIGKHECENGSYGIVVINLNPVEIEHNYTEVGCEIITTTEIRSDPESNGK